MKLEELFKIITQLRAKEYFQNVIKPTILRMPTNVSTLIQRFYN